MGGALPHPTLGAGRSTRQGRSATRFVCTRSGSDCRARRGPTWRRLVPVDRMNRMDHRGGRPVRRRFPLRTRDGARPRDLRANGLCRGVRGDLAHGAAPGGAAYGALRGRRTRLNLRAQVGGGLREALAGRAIGRFPIGPGFSRAALDRFVPAIPEKERLRDDLGAAGSGAQEFRAGAVSRAVHDDPPCRGLLGRHGHGR